jgi:guanylate kinase
MIFVLLGKSCSGKTTILSQLVEEIGLKRVVAATTRPKRKNEVNHHDYHFVTSGEFEERLNSGEIICHRSYSVNDGQTWNYGIFDHDLWSPSHKIMVVDLQGFIELKERYQNVIGIYLNVSDQTLFARAVARGDDLAEVNRRLTSDKEEFKDVCLFADHITSAKDMKSQVKEIIEGYLNE